MNCMVFCAIKFLQKKLNQNQNGAKSGKIFANCNSMKFLCKFQC